MKSIISSRLTSLLLLLLLFVSGCWTKVVKDEPHATNDENLLRVAFGSCNKHKQPQMYWQNINAYFSGGQGPGYPDIWIWAGDIVYADTRDEQALNDAYGEVKNSGDYKTFIEGCEKSNCDIVGVWDDHDFGENNLAGDSQNQTPFKKLTKPMRKAALLKFLGEPTTTKKEVIENKQIYTAYDYKGEDATIRIILLDLRYNRQDKGKTSNIMGKDQWDWLKKKLTADDVDLHLIVSSTQILRTDGKDSWGHYPDERKKLLTLIRNSPAQGIVLLTGDIHAAEISKLDDYVDDRGDNYRMDYPLYEITASGLNQARCKFFLCYYNLPNLYREGFVAKKNFGEIDISRSDDGTMTVLATLRSSQSPAAEILLRKNIRFPPR